VTTSTDPAGPAFDRLVEAMDGAMVVVTTAADGERNGCLVGFHCQCSIEPRRHAVWLSVANRTAELARHASHMAVHLLTADDEDLAERFGGQSGDEVDKLAGLDWAQGPGGVPLLSRLPNRFVGRIEEVVPDLGDHRLYVLDVVEAFAQDRPGPFLRLSDATDIDPGHEAEERR
jgi:flavin reductase (DIM6/NTAB) family NADH-FMN oxidoreductase RutF